VKHLDVCLRFRLNHASTLAGALADLLDEAGNDPQRLEALWTRLVDQVIEEWNESRSWMMVERAPSAAGASTSEAS
jgi:hypothetical protein